MRVSRTRFSKRRSKRKTSFPVIAIVKKKTKVKYNAPHSFSFFEKEGTYLQNEVLHAKSSTDDKGTGNGKGKALTVPLIRGQETRGQNKISTNQIFSNSSQTKQKDNQLFYGPAKKSRATIDYKNVVLLRKLITAEGKILPRRINKLTAKQQRHTAKAIKSARIMGLLPFINKSRPLT